VSSRYPENGAWAVEPSDLVIGQRVKLDEDRWWWTVRAVSEHFAVVTRQARFKAAGTQCYSVLDWRNGVRGAVNLVFGWYGDLDEAGCAQMLRGFEADDLHVSQRNWCPLRVAKVERPA
jgi:hypothetical protein